MRIYKDSEPYKICFHIQGVIPSEFIETIKFILLDDSSEFKPDKLFLENHIEIGPRNNFKTSWNSNVIQIFKRCGIDSIESVEYTTFYPKDAKINIDKMLFTNYDTMEEKNKEFIKSRYVIDIRNFNNKHKLGFDYQDIDYYNDIFAKLKRCPTNVELYDLAQCNSEHARHWFFRGIFSLKGKNIEEKSLIDKLKTTLNNNDTSLISFKDNASVIKGNLFKNFIVCDNKLTIVNDFLNFSYKAETHNFPTGISPFPGAATGVGGRIRDNIAVGVGGRLIAGTAGYCVGDIDQEYDYQLNSPRKILIEASNGASDYGNKIGEPLIQGFTRAYRKDFEQGRIEWLKPIMFSGGMGRILNKDCNKKEGSFGDLIVRIGGPAYNIGMGGGSASSRSQDNANQEQDFSAVQRGDPEMANKLVRFVEQCCIIENNPIISIHDQGSGGMANVTREISEPLGAKVFLDNLDLGDKSMNSLEKWVAEFQEQVTILIKPENYGLVKKIAKRENVPLKVVGYIDNQKTLEVVSNFEDNKVVDLPILEDSFKKVFPIEKPSNKYTLKYNFNSKDSLIEKVKKVFNHISVCSKGFLVNKVDRSVTGLIAQQQCVGPFQLPLSNYSIVMGDYLSNQGMVSAIGEKPINGLYDKQSMVEMTISEMLCNMVWAPIRDIRSINSVANWMWSSTEPTEAYGLRESLDHLVGCVKKLGFSINGGKDSLSMNVKSRKQIIKSPNTLVLSGYTNCTDINKKITPDLKSTSSTLLLLKINDKQRIGGSIYQDIFNLDTKNKCPRIDDMSKLKNIFDKVQRLISYNLILSGHDRSDGGLLTTLFEMSISSGIGLNIDGHNSDYLFNEEMGLVIEIENSNVSTVIERLYSYNIKYDIVAHTNRGKHIIVSYNNKLVLKERINAMRLLWSERSLEMEKEQTNLECIEAERKQIINESKLSYNIDDNIVRRLLFYEDNLLPIMNRNKYKVAVLRDEGSNGDKEMRAAFYLAGFDVYDISMADLLAEDFSLSDFRGIVFVGGFSYSDVLGAGAGWNNVIIHNKVLKKQFDDFYKRLDTFSLGICNGCQVMSLLGYIEQGITLTENNSGRFESRFNLVKIGENNSIFLNNMEDMVMGIWSAHGEGKIIGDTENIKSPIKYVDNEWQVTEKYPYNPNGSKGGICSFSSKCGRHLAIMPHPERCFLTTQLPYLDKSNLNKMKLTPWALMFKNAYNWCSEDIVV
jgi:phosphoribosylformylglycinamidine synthase